MSAPGRGASAGAAAARRPFAVAGAVLVLGLAYAVLAGWRAPYDARPGAPVGQSLGRWWRIGHLALAGLAVVGLVAHVVTVLFFAQWAAGDRPVYWWHVRW